MEHIHLVGIGGTGLSAIAKVLLGQGYTVSGSDQQYSELAEMVDQAGGRVYVGHRADQVVGADRVVISSAIPEDNVEVQAARDQGLPVLKRRQFLPYLMEGKKVVAVAGSHGKTTTTSMLIWMLTELGQRPSFIVGGVVENLGTNAAAGSGDLFVIEADEYDRMFLGLEPDLEVITNVEHDHPDLFPSWTDFREAFRAFVGQLKPGGTVILCQEDPGSRGLSRDVPGTATILSYGWEEDSDYQLDRFQIQHQGGTKFNLISRKDRSGAEVRVELTIPGRHNALNAAGALAALDQLGFSARRGARALGVFRGTGRRFEILGTYGTVTLVDDYAHHPTEIQTTIQAARDRFPDQRLWVIWEPHTYSRLQALEDRFQRAFQGADQVLITKVYPAREAKPAGFSIQELAEGVDHPAVRYVSTFEQVLELLGKELTAQEVVIVLSAGDAVEINQALAHRLQARSNRGGGRKYEQKANH